MKFERVSKYPDAVLPVRKTAKSAGYDFTVAEDIVIPAYVEYLNPKSFNLSSIIEVSVVLYFLNI